MLEKRQLRHDCVCVIYFMDERDDDGGKWEADMRLQSAFASSVNMSSSFFSLSLFYCLGNQENKTTRICLSKSVRLGPSEEARS